VSALRVESARARGLRLGETTAGCYRVHRRTAAVVKPAAQMQPRAEPWAFVAAQ
jgi:hypothetical protein